MSVPSPMMAITAFMIGHAIGARNAPSKMAIMILVSMMAFRQGSESFIQLLLFGPDIDVLRQPPDCSEERSKVGDDEYAKHQEHDFQPEEVPYCCVECGTYCETDD